MSVRLVLAETYIPVFIRKRELKKLSQLAAAAFARKAPSLEGLSPDDILNEFAAFTKTSVDQTGDRETTIAEARVRLFQLAYEYGKLWRKRLGVSTMEEVMRAGRILYRAIGIDFQGTVDGEVEIRRCFFSRYYSPATCRVISALDEGIMAGLSDGKELSFSERITEGFGSCKAQLRRQGQVG